MTDWRCKCKLMMPYFLYGGASSMWIVDSLCHHCWSWGNNPNLTSLAERIKDLKGHCFCHTQRFKLQRTVFIVRYVLTTTKSQAFRFMLPTLINWILTVYQVWLLQLWIVQQVVSHDGAVHAREGIIVSNQSVWKYYVGWWLWVF